jgi:GAF domain-containing protein
VLHCELFPLSGPGPSVSPIESERSLSELAGLLLSDANVSGLLEVIVNVAVSAVAGVDGASVSLLISEGKSFETTNASSELIREIDEVQYEGGGGPCVEAIRTGEETRFSMETDQWPVFAEAATQAGVHSVWSLPLHVRGRTTGALNLYAMTGEAWAGPSDRVARELAFQAAIVLANAAALMSAESANENLRIAMETRDVIGQAKGILMARQSLNSDEAFDVLRRASQRSNRKLRDIAMEVVGRVAHPDEPT